MDLYPYGEFSQKNKPLLYSTSGYCGPLNMPTPCSLNNLHFLKKKVVRKQDRSISTKLYPNDLSISMSLITNYIPDVKRLCGSGAVGQSLGVCGELGKGGSPLGIGLGWRKLSENNDCDSVTAPSKGDRAL